ncbi:D-alanine--D-alanine ligase [Pseudoalteromonas sp. CO348]|uniref:D-alanine--D-alanine ligase family protein n=1 Tax=unclassified Pseudoalteromonas TaxID=194690 RepID=UPI001022F803|nr:D-alanine--D-alanine ligase [Pseudoalteromonas sp. CO348]MCG7540022.1 D-alanine--D-alanine ligase [Pseudoalteromonas sp. OF7H-1]RZG07244.1 D-alanine--D-alanine ligase [Pseudoalteromonas sp. CO348]
MKIAILCGGNSTEREVSLQTAESSLKALLAMGHDAHMIDTQKTKLTELKKNEWDFAFIALHGKGGEDGVAQAVLSSIGIPYSGCGVAASAIAMEKHLAKMIWKYNGLSTPDFLVIEKNKQLNLDDIMQLGLPLIVKPNRDGCSFGLSLVESKDAIFLAIEKAMEYSETIILESYIKGREFTIPILNDRYLGPVEIIPENKVFDYESKFNSGETKRVLSPDLSSKEIENIGQVALDAFKSIGGQVYGRVDLIYCESSKKPFLLEINTIPGMTYASIFLDSAKESGLSRDEVFEIIISESMKISRD